MLICMHSTSVRIDTTTHEDSKRLPPNCTPPPSANGDACGSCPAPGRAGADLRTLLWPDETDWLDAELG